MAKSKHINYGGVFLGFEDEIVTDKHKFSLGYWTNKIGGCPDWPVDGISQPLCKLCGLKQLLIVQVYAPLEKSPYHRTLYVFACINPNCWNQNQAWTCLRSQLMDTQYDTNLQAAVAEATVVKAATDWCSGADEWGTEDDDNGNFEICSNSKQPSDESDDSSSLSMGLGNLHVDECNANWGGATGNSGAVGKQTSPVASAEIEGDESEVVSIDTPTAPQRDLFALLQETAPVPLHLRSGQHPAFKSSFMSVWDECDKSRGSTPDHVRDLMKDYQSRGQHAQLAESYQGHGGHADSSTEQYERAVPVHGDKMFHQFITRMQANPGQILRYSREGEPPLLLYPLLEHAKICQHCSGEMLFEMQLLPTLIPKLRLPGEEDCVHVEFGTVLVYTCRRSCWSTDDRLREERIVVQVERT